MTDRGSRKGLRLASFAAASLAISGAISWWLGAPWAPPAPRGAAVRLPEVAAALPEPEDDSDIVRAPAEPPPLPSAERLHPPEHELPNLDQAARDLTSRGLLVPVAGFDPEDLSDNFPDPRSGGRRHEALDIMAPRRTPVVAVEEGRVARIFESRRGGLSLYQLDPTETFAYFYAHLDGYADDLAEGDLVSRGQVLGYVGTTGNAPRDAPHLHFAIFLMPKSKRWWRGKPINPYPILRGGTDGG